MLESFKALINKIDSDSLGLDHFKLPAISNTLLTALIPKS